MLSITCLLGLTWTVGFFYVPENPAPTAYLFVILNGLQVRESGGGVSEEYGVFK